MPANNLQFTNLSHRLKQQLNLLLTGSIIVLLSACSGPATKPEQSTKTEPQEKSQPVRALTYDELLALAEQSSTEQAQVYRFKAAEILAQEGKAEAALRLLAKIHAYNLPLEQQKRFVFLTSKLSLNSGEGWQALIALNNTGNLIYDRLSPSEQLQLTQYRAQAYSKLGYYEASAREYLQLSQQQIGENQQRAHEALWVNILNITLDDIRLLLEEEVNNEMRGWFDLARVRKEAAINLDQFTLELNRWLDQWHDHPAALSLPRDMAFLDDISRNPIQHIAIFLPQSGKLSRAGNAIRDGLMAATLNAKTLNAVTPKISFFDSNKLSLNQLYQAAKAVGAEVAVGPLAKNKVTQLQQRSQLPLPTLALNYGTQGHSNNKDLFQYAISPEDEASQAAITAWQDGKKLALTLTPSSSWGSRALTAFKSDWKKQGGSIASSTSYNSKTNLGLSIKEMLEIDKSEQRWKKIRQLMGKKVEFEARRRQDIDMLFMVATSGTARQVKPALAFYYAGDLPVYATSHLYNGKTNPERDQDLNGINFCDIPWFLESQAGLKLSIDKAWPIETDRYGRLFAMGTDALQLAGRLRMLEAISGSKVYGATGALSLRNNRTIQRQLQWATFVEGLPVMRHHLNTPKS